MRTPIATLAILATATSLGATDMGAVDEPIK